MKAQSDPPRRRLWPAIVNLWLGGVLLAFVVIRLLGSATFKHEFHRFLGY